MATHPTEQRAPAGASIFQPHSVSLKPVAKPELAIAQRPLALEDRRRKRTRAGLSAAGRRIEG